MRKHKTRAIASGILAALVLALSALSAQAAIWSGAWDPQFGSPFTTSDIPPFGYNLGWGGKVKVSTGSCSVPNAPGDVLEANLCGAAIVPGSLSVTLYDVANPTPVLNTLNFGLGNLVVDRLRYDGSGHLTGFSTADLTVSDGVSDGPAGTSSTFYINFVLDGLPCLLCPTNFAPLPGNYDGPVLFAVRQVIEPALLAAISLPPNGSIYRSDIQQYRPQINFTPEPGSLALIAIGMLAAGSGLRRRLVARGRRLG